MTNPSPAPGGADWCRIVRSSPVARRIAHRWRLLTRGGGRTVVACSGGADSSALALALAAFADDLVIAHIVHDLRPEAEAHADRDRTRGLSDRLGVAFVERSVTVRGVVGNAEANARRARYSLLGAVAASLGAPFVATGHHADDQFETVVMALVRGAGPRGLRGIAPRRGLAPGVTLVRPMLRVTRREAEALCREVGHEWAVDRTNLETDRLRAALRAGPLAEIARLKPGAPSAASRAAELQRDSARLIEDAAREVFADESEWPRATLRWQRAVVLGAGLRRAAGGVGADRLSRAVVDPVIRAIKDSVTDPRRFDWPGGLRVEVTARTVRMVRSENESPG